MSETPKRQIVREPSQQVAVLESALGGVLDEVQFALGVDAPSTAEGLQVLWAEAGLATEKPADERDARERTLARMREVVPAMRRMVQAGLVTSEDDSRDLASGLMFYSGSPYKALTYLTGTSRSLVTGKRTPRELINALIIHQDILDGELNPEVGDGSRPTLATIFRAADSLGVILDTPLPDEQLGVAIAGGICAYAFRRDISNADEDGEIYHTYPQIDATDLGQTAIGFAALSSTDQGRDGFLEDAFLDSED